MAQPVIIADYESSLSTAISVGATTFSISSGVDDDGVALPSGTYYFTVDNGSSSKEYLTGILSGTSVTAVKHVSRQGAETSGANIAHRVGSPISINDFATYKKYIDAVSLAGASIATNIIPGIVRLSAVAALAGDPIAVGDNDPRIPTANGLQFLNSVVGMIVQYAGSSTPAGFLPCDGGEVSRATYAALFTAIGTTYGAGNGTTTFNVPDGRGRTMIGAGTGTKVATFASRSGNVITVTGLTNANNNAFQTGQAVTYASSGTTIGGLTTATVYYLIRVSNTTFSLATTLANAQNGNATALSSDGTGTRTFTLALSARTLGDTGGEENHAMSSTELVSHSHSLGAGAGSSYSYGSTGGNSIGSTDTTGGNAAMNIMSPFFVANWIIKT